MPIQQQDDYEGIFRREIVEEMGSLGFWGAVMPEKYGGTGLGLSAARRIIKRHGGRISVRSQLERGTCFTVYLPAQAPENAKHSPTTVA